MKKTLLVAAAMTLGSALAAPFVYPAAWTAEPNTANKRGGEFRSYTISDPKTFNPFVSAESGSPSQVIGDGALLFVQDPVDYEFIPKMAAEMPKVSNGGKRFVVKIRPGMKFSDGQEITADDWVTTANIHKDDKVGSNIYDSFYINKKPITVKKIDKYTLQFDFPQQIALAYAKMSFVPWPDHVFGPVYKSKGAAGIKMMWGTNSKPGDVVSPGLWGIESFKPGERIVYERNKYYGEWNKDSKGNPLPYLDRYSERILSDINAGLAAYLSGQVDVGPTNNTDRLAQIKKAINNKSLKGVLIPNISAQASSNWITFNWNRSSDPFKQKLFRDARFRQAMSHIANRKAMIDLAMGGLGTETYFSVYPIFKEWIPNDVKTYKYDLAAASKLLTQMGFGKKNKDGYLVDKSGKVLEFTLNTNAGNNQNEQMGRIFADEAKKVGVKVDFKPIDFNNLVDMLMMDGAERKFDAILLSFNGGTNVWPFIDNGVPCGSSLHSYNKPSNGACLNPQETTITKLFYQGQATLDSAARRKIGANLLKVESALQPFVYLAAPNYHVTFNDRLGGEYPRKLMNAYNGSRNIALTFVK